MKAILFTLALVSGVSHAAGKLYFVEPMICKGKWNKQPPQYDPSYEQAGIRVVSFWSVRKSDCSLAPSSATDASYSSIKEDLKIENSLAIGGWIANPLKIDGDTVKAPNGVWANPLELKIVASKNSGGKRIDTLKGRDVVFGDYYYDLTCKAVVVSNPSTVDNNTSNCPKK